MDVGPLGEEPESAGDLTWFLVCCCALSLLLGCRGVSLGMGPIGVGCRRRKHTEAVSIDFQRRINEAKKKKKETEDKVVHDK